MLKVLYFGAPWCAPCKALHPQVVALCKERKVTLVEYDVMVHAAIANEYSVQSVPMIIVMDGTLQKGRATNLAGLKGLLT